ncbi:MAG: hypothetical protein PHX50_16655 [Massilibacteroides sp.]|nr:hypothetical protein [Massilibacteroides sp.]MDD3064424.1 hypothetical protein [Massilibacteroides sp.]MDD4659582.1 hypothetical protein [Massilibacteroides sp.]
MKDLIKYLGVIILLIGVVVLAVPTFQGTLNNTLLIVGFTLIIVGYLGHIVINKKVE